MRGDVQAPALGVFLDVQLDGVGDLLAVGQELVEGHLADHVAERRLGVLGDGIAIVLHLDDGVGRSAHAKEQGRVDRHRHVVAGDRLLFGMFTARMRVSIIRTGRSSA